MVPEMHSANDTALPRVARLNESFEDGRLAQPSDHARSHVSQNLPTDMAGLSRRSPRDASADLNNEFHNRQSTGQE